MTREQLEAIAATGTDFGDSYRFTGATTQQMHEIIALARRGLEAERVMDAARRQLNAVEGEDFPAVIMPRDAYAALRRACELAREYRQKLIAQDESPDWLKSLPGWHTELDAALAAIGMPVEE